LALYVVPSSPTTNIAQKRLKVEDVSPTPNAATQEGFASMAGDPNLIALGSMAMMPNFQHHPNHNFNPAFGGGGGLVQQPMMMQHMNFLGASSPGYHYHAAGQQPHNIGHYLYGYGPGFAAVQHHTTTAMNGGKAGTPGDRSNDDGVDGEGVNHRRTRPMSGMTPLVFAGMPSNFQGSFQPVLQVVSTDSQADDHGNGLVAGRGVRMLPMGNVMVPMQQLKKWVRWSDHEDQALGRAVEQYGENNFRHISEQIFHGSRTEVQCKNRWKKVSCTSSRVLILFFSGSRSCRFHLCGCASQCLRHSNPDSSRVDGPRRRTTSSPSRSRPGTTSGPKSPSAYPVALESRSRSAG